MDPLSAAASVIAVVQTADRIIDLCKAYITGVKDAPAELRAILIEAGSVKCVLEVIELLDASGELDSDHHNLDILGKLQHPLEGCKAALKSLEALFPPQPDNPARAKRKKPALSLTTLAWPFKREKALKFLEEIARHKSTITLGLTTDAAWVRIHGHQETQAYFHFVSSQDLKYIRKNVEKIGEAITSERPKLLYWSNPLMLISLPEADMAKVLKWLVTTDPSSVHDNACALHEDHTGQWLANSPEYADWKSGRSRFIWLHGISGSGKTVLHSFIAEDLKRHCRQHDGSVCAFYYCYFARNQDETTHFLRWVINELCRKIGDIPARIYAPYIGNGGYLGQASLLSMLEAVTGNFFRVYITIDALDESVNREHLLKLLRTMVGHAKLGNLRLLATSRKELDIERALLPLATGLSLSNPYVDEDIRTYVKGRLQEDAKFGRWPESLKRETEEALVKGAKGM
jgi:NACHT domain